MKLQEMAARSHILAVLYPLQGHINPTIQLCSRLIANHIRVTFVVTAATASSLHKQESFTIETVADAVAPGAEATNVIDAFIQNYRASIILGLPEIIRKHGDTELPVKAILYDSVCPWILDLAHENGVKGAALFTQNFTVCSIFYHIHHKGTDLASVTSDEEAEISLPGMAAMRRRDLPTFEHALDMYAGIRRLVIDQFSTFGEADWRLFNTFEKLEDEVIKWMESKHSTLTVGPIIPSMYVDKRIKHNYNYGINLSNPNPESCIDWLDSKPDHSVIYASFGSLASLSKTQMEELATGLARTGLSFIWVVRTNEQSKLPQDFISNSASKGLVLQWCNQLEVLSHRAVGCFLTHCGWNSTIEALSIGVPMVVMPQWTDQPTNSKMVVDVWEVGVRVRAREGGIVGWEEIVRCVEEVMGGEMRRNALKWKEFAVEAISEGGSSDKNIMKLVMDLSG